MSKPKRYSRAFAEAEAASGNSKATIATNIYLTMAQLAKVERLVEQRRKRESEKLGRELPKMSVSDFFRLVVDELPE